MDYYIYKLLLNSSLGRFDLVINRSITKIVDKETYEKI